MPFPLIFILFIGFFVFVIVMGNRALAAKRMALEEQTVALRGRIDALRDASQGVDENTARRVQDAMQAAEGKLQQAKEVSQRGRDRDFARAYRTLDQARAKLDNAQNGVNRAQARIAEREAVRAARLTQKQAELETKREAARAERAAFRAQQRTSASSFGAKPSGFGGKKFGAAGIATSRSTNWNEAPRGQRGVCFFCSRPGLLREFAPVTISQHGVSRRVLACPDDYDAMERGSTPQVRVFFSDGFYVPWYDYAGYDPFLQYYAEDAPPEQFYPVEQLPPVFWDAPPEQPTANDYVTTPDDERYQDYYHQQAADSPDIADGAFDPGAFSGLAGGPFDADLANPGGASDTFPSADADQS